MLIFNEKIKLDFSKVSAPDEGHDTTFTLYVPNDEELVHHYTYGRATVIVLPGGGYGVTSPREADPIAIKFLAHGFNVGVLRYSCKPSVFPVAMLEALTAVKYVREKAGEIFASPDRIYLCGFSAGGHLAACCGTLWHRSESEQYFGDTSLVKPDGLILGYPVITSGGKAHNGSFRAVMGDKYPDPELLEYLSLEKQVDEHTPKSFIFQTFKDQAVPVENSLLFASALTNAGIPYELHIFQEGPHGISTADKMTTPMLYPARTRSWIDMASDWIEEQAQDIEYAVYKPDQK